MLLTRLSKKTQNGSAHGSVATYGNLWDEVEDWTRSETMQQKAKEIEREHVCLDYYGRPRCTIEGSKSACRTASCQTCVGMDWHLCRSRLPSEVVKVPDFASSQVISTDLYSIQSSSRKGC